MGKKSQGEFRVISNNVRFGCGCREHDGRMVYFAWHGFPHRNDDYFTTAEITKEEYDQIAIEYPEEISANSKIGDKFYDKYVKDHKVLYEGWNRLIWWED